MSKEALKINEPYNEETIDALLGVKPTIEPVRQYVMGVGLDVFEVDGLTGVNKTMPLRKQLEALYLMVGKKIKITVEQKPVDMSVLPIEQEPGRRDFSMPLPALLEFLDTAQKGIDKGDTTLVFLVHDNKADVNQVVYVDLKESTPIEQQLEAGLLNTPGIDGYMVATKNHPNGCMPCTRIYLPFEKYDKWQAECRKRTSTIDEYVAAYTQFHDIPVYCGGPDIHYCTG